MDNLTAYADKIAEAILRSHDREGQLRDLKSILNGEFSALYYRVTPHQHAQIVANLLHPFTLLALEHIYDLQCELDVDDVDSWHEVNFKAVIDEIKRKADLCKYRGYKGTKALPEGHKRGGARAGAGRKKKVAA